MLLSPIQPDMQHHLPGIPTATPTIPTLSPPMTTILNPRQIHPPATTSQAAPPPPPPPPPVPQSQSPHQSMGSSDILIAEMMREITQLRREQEELRSRLSKSNNNNNNSQGYEEDSRTADESVKGNDIASSYTQQRRHQAPTTNSKTNHGTYTHTDRSTVQDRMKVDSLILRPTSSNFDNNTSSNATQSSNNLNNYETSRSGTTARLPFALDDASKPFWIVRPVVKEGGVHFNFICLAATQPFAQLVAYSQVSQFFCIDHLILPCF